MHLFLTTLTAACLTSATLAAPPAYHTAVNESTPILWYQFNEPSGNAHNYGSLGATIDATYSAPVGRTTATYSGDTGARFATPDAFMQSLGSSTLTGNPTFTIEAIVNLQTAGAAGLWGPLLHWGNGGASPTGREVYFSIANDNNSLIYAGFYNAGVRTASPVTTNRWIHIVWVRQGGTDTAAGTTLYINGVAVAMQQDQNLSPGFLAASGIIVNATPFHINLASDFIGSRFFTGTIDELALYSRALSVAEVQSHFLASDLCYANCDHSAATPILNANDFQCFLNQFAAGDSHANCDGSTATPILNANDFQCFLNAFAAGCL